MKQIIKILLTLLIVSCSREYIIPDTKGENDEKSIMLKVAVPYVDPNGTASRSIGATQENTIETLDILAFKVEGGVETFLYRANAKKNAANIEGAQSQSFSVKLRVKDFEQRFVLISNAHSKVETLIGSRTDGWVGQNKEALLSQLTVDLNGGDRWKAISASNYAAIPMWGETAPKVISAATTSISDGPIPMLRMIAKIEVQLDVANYPAITSAFKLKSVHVYNTNTSGRIVPISGTEYVGTDMIAKQASLPYPVTSVVGPLEYNDFGSPGSPDIAMKGAIYLFETAAKNAGNFLHETCIVVGGIYGADTQESYYRLDFFAQDGATYLDILRNHKYTCNIVEVRGPGLPTVDDAYRARSFNMVAKILIWNEGDIRDIVFDGQNMLGVSHDRFELTGEAHTIKDTDNILKVITDYPTGWSATVWGDLAGTQPVPNDLSTGAAWLSITPASGAGNATLQNVSLLTSANNTGADRTAYIHIKAGRLTYVVTVVQGIPLPGTITVSPKSVVLPYTAQSPASQSLTVARRKSNGAPDPAAGWTLTVPTAATSWLKISLNPADNFTTASQSVTVAGGTGNGTDVVYLFATANNNAGIRSAQLLLDGAVAVTVTQNADLSNIIDTEGGGTPPKDGLTYVGAFWKAGETGERIIRVDVKTNQSNWGSWRATVAWMDARWGAGDGVILATDKLDNTSLAARGISFTSDMDPDSYGAPEDCPVTGDAITISSDVMNGYIIFRIGLKTKYAPTAQYPARYAVVLLSYANETKHQKIFLRQGEGADYLMTNSDPISSGNLSSRTVTRMISPYNLTAATLNAQVGINGAQPNPGIFTDYPTKAGAFFQWACDGNLYNNNQGRRWAWDPYTANNPGGMSGWPADGFWDALKATHETCPAGYRRINDGSISGNETNANIANSEIRQSLMQKPVTGAGYTSDKSNSIEGYYADGFFDRRQIVSSANGVALSTVSAGTRNVAYIGRLFFNPNAGSDRSNASLFFPYAGYRDGGDDGKLTGAGGIDGGYWTASAYSTGSILFMRFQNAYHTAAMWSAPQDEGYSVRCIKIP
jgi:hypothetical protein